MRAKPSVNKAPEQGCVTQQTRLVSTPPGFLGGLWELLLDTFLCPSSSDDPHISRSQGGEGEFDSTPAGLGPDPLGTPSPSRPNSPPQTQSDVTSATSSPASNPLPVTLSTLGCMWEVAPSLLRF